ncbi:endonuclease/exonuclease/phosphatase [Methanosarcina sp. KYL-1]|uniref:exonuclease/endonuclease/phosphatase family protein n=1 Tax=Methanosarcina sp. KYL-1 TaxID=2602068 RepID=UPI0021019A12|nr:endonuclease/exonuclease/phosphatase family protein [Methanosarcina sp. KYL-1]MCQ1537070.1 endonuclease/exonuclease/phosphatase [Methanosarcina sp. KYL-1]
MDLKTFWKGIIPLAVLLVLFSGCIDSPGQGETVDETVNEGISDADLPSPEVSDGEAASQQPLDETGGAEGGDLESSRDADEGEGTDLREVRGESSPASDAGQPAETLRVGAFNIQVFGVSKASDPEVMEVLAEIIRTYDVVAVQEIRDKSQTALPQLVDAVNSEGAQYSFAVSERLGRTTSKEQYAYVYDSTRVRLAEEPGTYPEPEGTDPFHREPYIALFELPAEDFSFALVTVHTDPDEATEEINSLDDVIAYARERYPEEDDFILMGDLNADGSYFDEDSANSLSGEEYSWLINNSLDTTTGSTDCTYDRIIATGDAESHFTGDAGVFRYDLVYNLSSEKTEAVSDHYPVYAEFLASGDGV